MTKKEILTKIHELDGARSDWFVSKKSMEFMKEYCQKKGVKTVLEIGTHIGYSALNFAIIVEHVTTIEKDKVFLKEARKNCNLTKKITLIEGDALNVLEELKEKKKKFDCIFIDGHKPDYSSFLKRSISLLNKKGVIFIDNTISHKKKVLDFWSTIKSSGLSFKELGVGDGLIIASKTKKD